MKHSANNTRDIENKIGRCNNKDNYCIMLRFTILLSLILYLQAPRHVSGFSAAKQSWTEQIVSTITNNGTPVQNVQDNDTIDSLFSRRSMLVKSFTAAAGAVTMTVSSDSCNAATPKSKIDPETAYLNLRKAREELVFAGRTYFPKQNWDGLREYLSNEDACINNYDVYANALLTSKRLDAESKQAIGTIRRYGVGADVIIMYGGLKAELSEDNEQPNSSEISKYYVKALDSLEEVIAIVQSNSGFSKLN